MGTSKAATVAQFLAGSDPAVKPALTALRRLVRKAAPDAREGMAYGMPVFSVNDTPIASFNAQKHYLAFYLSPELVAAHRRALAGLDVGKCCIRARRLELYPLDVLERMVRAAAAEARAKEPEQAAARKPTRKRAPAARRLRR
jgi:uncharacterized protein YdhG (YjbR/CyaY superfamily)